MAQSKISGQINNRIKFTIYGIIFLIVKVLNMNQAVEY